MSSSPRPIRIGVLTSGGDAPGMNSALRAVTRTALNAGAQVYAIREGWQGAVDGGDQIAPLGWQDVSGILQRGGTVIGTARCAAFRERDGRRTAVKNLVLNGIDRLAVIGGDGSLSGADELREEWPDLLDELVANGDIDQQTADAHRSLMIAGLVGSIDNDMVGTDMTIGADSALHRITDAIDAITATAASHQRTFIIKVMGRNCGYLALMSAIAGGADYLLIPELPPEDGWEDEMCRIIGQGREAGRRDTIIVVAEGARDRHGEPITTEQVQAAVQEKLGQDARVTDLGHVQRGGTPSAYDRWMSSLVGVAAAEVLLNADSTTQPVMVGVRHNNVVRRPLMDAVQRTRSVGKLLTERDFAGAAAMRGSSFRRTAEIFEAISQAKPTAPQVTGKRIAVMHGGGLAPGMNSVVHAVVRLGIDLGHTMVGIEGGFPGFARGQVRELTWADVEGWAGLGGALLGTRRALPTPPQLSTIAQTIEDNQIDALLVVGGIHSYDGVAMMTDARAEYPAFAIPTVVLPASIDNNLPSARMAVGSDSALGSVVEALDRVKQSAWASRRSFVVETMGRRCGFLAMASGLAGGAERIYLHEDPVHLADLEEDVRQMRAAFEQGRRFWLAVRSEDASDFYTTDVLRLMFTAESGELFDVRQHVVGHVQQGVNPSPFDRMTAARYAATAIRFLDEQLKSHETHAGFIGEHESDGLTIRSFEDYPDLMDFENSRPKYQWWHHMREVAAKVNTRPFADLPIDSAPANDISADR